MTAPKVTHETSIVLSPNSSPKIDANELRWLGEEADGKRDGDYVVVWREKNGKRVLGLEEISNTVASETIAADFVVRTNNEGEGMRGIHPVSITWKEKQVELFRIKNGKKEYPDAIFWTQSAFLKFVIPYYARMRSTGNLDAMRRKYFGDPKCLAVIHFFPSEDEKFAPSATSFCGVRETDSGGFELMDHEYFKKKGLSEDAF